MPTKKPTKKNTAITERGKSIEDFLFLFHGEKIVIPRRGIGRSEKGRDYRYATLDDVINSTREALQKHGLVYTQVVYQGETGATYLKTVLTAVNATAEPRSIETSIPTGKPESTQDMGSRITYMRRYALVPMLGLSIEDDLDAVPPEVQAEVTVDDVVDVMMKKVEQEHSMPPIVNHATKPLPSTESPSPVVSDPKETPGKEPDKKFFYTSEKARTKLQPIIDEIVNRPKMSASHEKAYNAVMSCANEEALELMKSKVRASEKLNDAEKADMEKVIVQKEEKLGIVHV